MKIREKIGDAVKAMEKKFVSQFGFHPKETSFGNVAKYMYMPKDPSSLAVTRILFGLCMTFDIPDERGGAAMETRWGDPNICHFPLLPFLQAISMPYMAIVYAGLWSGAIGIMVGLNYRISAVMFNVCYWYLFLIEKSFWNNHSYLFGLVAFLLTFTEAGCYWSMDVYLDPSKLKIAVPYWNYFILKYQFFILYFLAGVKKATPEWLSGYSARNLSEHWVFTPFKLFMTVPQIDFLIVHWFIFVFDLTVAMWMMYRKSRYVAMAFCALFHLMNIRLFNIGMFPWVCLATMPLFCPCYWPKILLYQLQVWRIKIKHNIAMRFNFILTNKVCERQKTAEEKDDAARVNIETVYKDNKDDKSKESRQLTKERKGIEKNEQTEDRIQHVCKDKENTPKLKIKIMTRKISVAKISHKRQKITLCLILFYVVTQAVLPFSHFITKGYNNWVDGLYGYSWDMMVHAWSTHAVIVKVVDNEKQTEFYIDPHVHTLSDRWSRHNDMVYQYARCLRERLIEKSDSYPEDRKISHNLSIYIDVWCSLNSRFTQRYFDAKVDILNVDWSPFKSSSFLMPLLDEALYWRKELDSIRKHVRSWNKKADVLFLAEFPGYEQEKFTSTELRNVSLTVLEGEIAYAPQVTNKTKLLQNGYSYKLTTGEKIPVRPGTFHKVLNIREKPSYYMYTFYNSTEPAKRKSVAIPDLPIFTEFFNRLFKMQVFLEFLFTNLGKIFMIVCNCN